MGGHNCAFFIAGIVEGILCGSNLHAKVLPVVHAPDVQSHEVLASAADGGTNSNSAAAMEG